MPSELIRLSVNLRVSLVERLAREARERDENLSDTVRRRLEEAYGLPLSGPLRKRLGGFILRREPAPTLGLDRGRA